MNALSKFLSLLAGGSPSGSRQRQRRTTRGRKPTSKKPTSKNTKRRAPRPKARPSRARPRKPNEGRKWSGIVYHGTPTVENARSISRHGFMVGGGNALGDGIYLTTNVATAKTYARSGGCYLRCRATLSNVCTWTSADERRYGSWCKSRNVRPDNSAKTAYLIQNGYDGVVSGHVIVVLAPQYVNPTAWKRKRSRKVRVLSAHRAATGAAVRL